MNFQLITTEEVRPGIALITMNRPERRNALSIQMREELYEALAVERARDSTRAVIITGAGPVFSSGFDLREFGQPERLEDLINSSARFYRELWYFPKAVICAIQGPALAGGLDICVVSDIRICTVDAVFGHPQVKFGGVPLYTPLRWVVGQTVARSMCLRGHFIDAAEALRVGLATEVVPAGQHVQRSIEVAEEILEAPHESMVFSKMYMARSNDSGFDRAFYFEHDDSFRRRADIIRRNRKG
ncbi:MAG: enoyl-CoA hydratase/isomerase family protein [Candidatus Lambdaproteobacteria bacterium]|nr:enoyl-CoA hydratase/isomerase family protein [Candidatus Lambdaproteobacteria bacterium]